MRRSNRNEKSRPQPPPEYPSEARNDSSIDSDVELELLASSGDEEQRDVNFNEGNAPPPPPSSPARPTGTDYVMRVQKRTFTVSRTLYKMKGQKYVGAWVPTW